MKNEDQGNGRIIRLLHRLLAATRFLPLLGIVGSLLLAAALFVVGLWRAVVLAFGIIEAVTDDSTAKVFAVATIEDIDFFLIATALYITGVGLYELFVGATPNLPSWLIIESLDDLKDKLLGAVVVVLAVTFLATATKWKGDGGELLQYALAVSAVILAITIYGSFRRDKHGGSSKAPHA